MKFELSQLRAFVAVAEANSFRVGAGAIGLAQSTVSQQISRLEANLGYRLFERTSRSMRMTSRGAAFLDCARGVIILAEDVRRRCQYQTCDGLLRIGLVEGYPQAALQHRLTAFRRTLPRFGLVLTTGPNARLLDALERGELDIALVERLPGRAQGRLFHTEPLAWCGRASVLSADGVTHVPIVARREPSAVRRLMVQALERDGRAFSFVAECDTDAAVRTAVASGFGITAFGVADMPSDLPSLVASDHGLPPLQSVEYAIDQRAQPHTAAMQLFLDVIDVEAAATDQPSVSMLYAPSAA